MSSEHPAPFGFARDDNGYLMSPSTTLRTARYALVSERIRLSREDMTRRVPQRLVGTARIAVTPPPGHEVFVGIAPSDRAEELLHGVATTTVTGLGDDGDPTYVQRKGGAPSQRPGASDIWVARSQGAGVQSMTWAPEEGEWTVVVMNADAGAGLEVAVSVVAVSLKQGGFVLGLLLSGFLAATGLTTRAPAR